MTKMHYGFMSFFLLSLLIITVVYISFYISADVWSGKYGMYEKISGCSFHPQYGAVTKNQPVVKYFDDKKMSVNPGSISHLPDGVAPLEQDSTILNGPRITSQMTNLFNDPKKGSVAVTNDDGALYGNSGYYQGVYTYVNMKGKWYFISTIIFEDGGVTQAIYVKVE